MRWTPLSLVLGLLLAAPACTAVVVGDILDPPEACSQVGDCAAGFACVANKCAAVDPASTVPGEGTVIGADGGVVEGPDGVTLDVDPGALADDVSVIITRASSTIVPPNIATIFSRYYLVTPNHDLAGEARIAINADACTPCFVFRGESVDDDAWDELSSPVEPNGVIGGRVATLGGYFVVGSNP